jgi:hypothetical protein
MKKDGLNYESGQPDKSARVISSNVYMEKLDSRSNEEAKSILEGSFPLLKDRNIVSK